MHKMEIIDGELGIVFPDDVIAAMGLKPGSTAPAGPDAGGFLLNADSGDTRTLAD